MAFVPKVAYTPQEFIELVHLPENADKRLEYIGEVYELVTYRRGSKIAGWILTALNNFIGDSDIGDVTGADGGYMVAEARVMPGVAFLRAAKHTEPDSEGYYPVAPDFIVEVISPSDLQKPNERISKKLQLYQSALIPLLWLVFPNRREVEVYEYGKLIRTAGIDDILNGGDVLPEFHLPVKHIFRD